MKAAVAAKGASAAVAEPMTGDGAAGNRSAAVSAVNPVPEPPFYGTRIIKGIPLAEYSAYLDERATFMGQWGLKPSRTADGPG